MKSFAGWSATLTLVAACAPSFGAGSGPVVRAWEGGGWPPLLVQPLIVAGPGPTGSVPAHPLAASGGLGDGDLRPHSPRALLEDSRLLVRPCSLEALQAPDPAPLPAAPPVYPSLGGPLPSQTPLDDLPALRDAARQQEPDDALRLIRTRW
jgi:hypothetical protein